MQGLRILEHHNLVDAHGHSTDDFTDISRLNVCPSVKQNIM